ncbi:hypothetical protein [Candidatus Burkholderia verschuerenii]|nr:hypothetical protein [Candidatus Burkholderia verschuerenii]
MDHAGCPVCVDRQRIENRYRADGLERLHEAAKRRGGKCLSAHYEGVEQFYTFCCAAGHQWSARGKAVLSNKWCRKCAGIERGMRRRYTDGLARLQGIAASHGGQCLSAAYESGAAVYQFRCAAGHEWEARGRKVLNDSWCMACVYDAKRLSLEIAQQEAAERGGQCLSTHYEGATKKMEWLCHRGHAWWASLSSVRADHWCPECAWLDRATRKKTRFKYDAVPAQD